MSICSNLPETAGYNLIRVFFTNKIILSKLLTKENEKIGGKNNGRSLGMD